MIGKRTLTSDEGDEVEVAVRELQVESVSYIVSRYLGIDNPFSRDYLLHYGNAAKDLVANMELIQKASHYMIEQIEQGTGEAPGIASVSVGIRQDDPRLDGIGRGR